MLFNSLEFIFFFIFVVMTYYALPHRKRWILLLGASYYFYMCWKPEYIILIIISTLVDYFAAIGMSHSEHGRKKIFLGISLVSNLGILFGFKYFNFFSESLREVFHSFNLLYNVPHFDLLLPVGISFYTFQTLSYSIDVYKGQQEPERHLGIFALYVSFFPQLVAGPIERPSHLIPQFHQEKKFNYGDAVEGMRIMLWGFFKKCVVADRLAVYVDAVYNNPDHHNGLTLAVATLFFSIQIYCDFSGYSNIAIGSARVMGVDLMRNFRRPYFAQSISEFWRRWHISLSTWFRDYLYIPLGGNRVNTKRRYFNIFTVFLVSGLWHGANWTFVVWGALHGFYLMMGMLLHSPRERFKSWLRIEESLWKQHLLIPCRILFNLIIVCYAWIFFRANTLSDAWLISSKIFTEFSGPLYIGTFVAFANGILAITLLFLAESNQEYFRYKYSPFKSEQYLIRSISYVSVIILILLLGVFDGGQFIYFQF